MTDKVIPPVDNTTIVPPVDDKKITPPVDDTPKDDKPVVPPVVDDKPKEDDNKPAEDKELDHSVWGDTGDEVGNSVLKVLQDSGVKPDTAKALLYDAVKSGDPTKIDKAALIEAVGKANANLILAGVDNFIETGRKKTQAVIDILHEEVGGKEAWDTMVTWAKKTLTPDEINDYIELVDQGGRKARMAAKDMRERYEAAGNTSITPDKTIQGGNKTNSNTTVTPLSRAAYYTEMEKLNRSGKMTEAAAKVLWTQREAGKKQGI